MSARLIIPLGGFQEIAAARTKFPKPIGLYGVLAMYGSNIVVSEADE